ncbi:MAG TPA: SGNH/GDSL hydrolase family protein [Pyrinomonadaceae bacterium]|nr:SGNH/GDSL hydrolase family protein [Pyrinomonadaceae bacterium]
MNLWLMQTIYLAGAAALLPFAPFLYLQGRYVRRKVGLLPDAAGGKTGAFGDAGETAEPVNLLAIGESTVAGLGAKTHETALAGQFARVLSEKTGKPVRWHVIGKNGVTAKRALKELLPQIPAGEKFDYIIVGLGGNDVLKLSSPLKWRRNMLKILRKLREKYPESVIFITNVAAIKLSPVLPEPIKFILWRLSRLHNANIKQFVREFTDVYYYEQPDAVPPDFFADGIHPSEAGYKIWSEEIIKTMNRQEQQKR